MECLFSRWRLGRAWQVVTREEVEPGLLYVRPVVQILYLALSLL